MRLLLRVEKPLATALNRYDRYWMGRTCWSDLIKNSRTLGRLIWYHVPTRLSPGSAPESAENQLQAMAEKRIALDLIEGYVFRSTCLAIQ